MKCMKDLKGINYEGSLNKKQVTGTLYLLKFTDSYWENFPQKKFQAWVTSSKYLKLKIPILHKYFR